MKCVGGKQKGEVLKEAVYQLHDSQALCGPDYLDEMSPAKNCWKSTSDLSVKNKINFSIILFGYSSG